MSGNDLTRIDERLERIETKLDAHLERVTRAESAIQWLQGHARISTTVFLGVIGALGLVLLDQLFGK